MGGLHADDLIDHLEADLLEGRVAADGHILDACPAPGKDLKENASGATRSRGGVDVDELFAPFKSNLTSKDLACALKRSLEKVAPLVVGEGAEDKDFCVFLEKKPRVDTQCDAPALSADEVARDEAPIDGLGGWVGSTHVTVPPPKVAEALALLGANLARPTIAEVERCFRRAALQRHPDKVPRSERSKAAYEFRELQKAKGIALRWLSRCGATASCCAIQAGSDDSDGDGDAGDLFAPLSCSESDSEKESSNADDISNDKMDIAAIGFRSRADRDVWSEDESGSDAEPLGLAWDAAQDEHVENLPLRPAEDSGLGCLPSGEDLFAQAQSLSRTMAARFGRQIGVCGDRPVCGECFEREVEPEDYSDTHGTFDEQPACKKCRLELRNLSRRLNRGGTGS